MFGFSMGEILLLAAIALIAIGPRQLPEVARTIGRLLNELRDATSDFQRAFFDLKNEADRSVEKFQSSVERSLSSPKQKPSESAPSLPPSPSSKAPEAGETQSDGSESKQLSFDLSKKGS